ncbi:AAA family ATPase [Thiolapillus sp.]
MRPLRLKMSAFGPFAATQEIDFSLLGDSPLFLINGPTGSGKTTILDAISYALYDETTGNERQGREMRSDIADAGLLTEVELEFELGARRYRIRRIPRQERPKARGEGTTTQQSEAELWELDAQGGEKKLLVPKKVTEASAEIVRLTGLSAEQFRQVMVLPQGRFRDLLLADSGQREDIFRQLFQTRIYTQLEQHLKEQAADIVKRMEQLAEQEKGLLDGVDADDRKTLSERIDALQQEVSGLRQRQQKAEKSATESRQLVFNARNLQQQFKELEDAQKQLDELLGRQALLDADRQRWQRAEKARILQPGHERHRRALQQCTETEQAAQDARHKLEQAQQLLKEVAQAYEQSQTRVPELEDLKRQQQQLQGYTERAGQLQTALDVLHQTQKKFARCREQEQTKEQDVRALREELEKTEQRLEQNAAKLQQLSGRQRELDALEQQMKDVQALDKLQQRLREDQEALAAAREAEKTAREKLQSAQQNQQSVERAWEQGQAAVLAQQLQPHAPCPVCGSTDHPQPARAGEALPDDVQRNKSREDVETAREQLQKAGAGVAAIAARQDALSQQQQALQEDLKALAGATPDKLQQQIVLARKAVSELRELQERADQLAGQRNDLRRTLQEAERIWQQLQREENELSRKLAAADQDVRNKRGELPQRYADPRLLENDLADTQKRLQTLQQQLEEARSAHEQARVEEGAARAALDAANETLQIQSAEKEKLTSRWQAALADSDFASEQDFLQAAIPDADRERLLQSIRHRDDELLAASTLMQEKNAAVAGQARPDMEGLEKKHQQREAEFRELAEACHRSLQRLQQLETVEKKLEGIADQQEKLHKDYALIGRLADVANGRNASKLSLHRFVLGVLLDDVLISARQRLLHMSKGRYQLLRREDVGDRRSSSGLDLVVEDAFSGKTRPVATLSGGESFMAALALALGLSEVVQAYAGGVRLDALFIDEGFGSLDPESLDLAINTLLDLQSSGRMVGIISHVPELRERIDVRLDIEADRSGSKVVMVT